MNSISSIALSGLNAAMLRLDAAGNNIANSQTPGYRRQSVVQTEDAGGGVSTSVERTVEPGENLAQDIVDQMSASYSFKANLRVVKTQDEMLGALLDVRA
jgi:flagellar hook protein FlgE